MLQKIFMTVLDMSIVAGYCAVFVMLARLFMRKLPKGYSYILWALVFVRLLLPVMPESAWSLLPKDRVRGIEQMVENVPSDIEKEDAWQAGVDKDGMAQAGANVGVGNIVTGEIGLGVGTGLLENESTVFLENARTETVWLTILGNVWLAGCVILLGYGMVLNIILEKCLQGAKKVEEGIFELANLPTAFVTGILKPRIYLPAGIPQEYRRYVLEHERTHLRRGDVWVKYIAYILTVIHWFNPLVWISYLLMCRDMEMSCDEQVLQNLGMEEKKAYSTALLAIASGRKLQMGMPVAFNESDAKKRIKNVLNYRKPVLWMTAAAGTAILVLALGLLSDPRNEQMEEDVATESKVEQEPVSEVPSESEARDYKLITPQYVAEVEQWVNVKANPSDMGFSRWFDEYGGGRLQNLVNYDGEKLLKLPEGVVFYQTLEDEWIGDSVRKMLDTSVELSIMELENDYQGRLWLVEYEDDVYFLMRFQNTYRLQRFEDMQTYKEKEVELEYVPIYAQDLEDKEILTEKLSYGVNAVFLFRDYEKVTEVNPMVDYDVVFDFTHGFFEEGMFEYYFDAEKYYQAMARKMGIELSEFLTEYVVKKPLYGRIYRGRRVDSVHSELEVIEVKRLDDARAEIYYSGTYYDGIVVMQEYEGEMIFLSNRKIYD